MAEDPPTTTIPPQRPRRLSTTSTSSRSHSPIRLTPDAYNSLRPKTPSTQLAFSKSPVTPLQAIYEAIAGGGGGETSEGERRGLIEGGEGGYGTGNGVEGFEEESDVEGDVQAALLMGRPTIRTKWHWVRTFFKFVGPGFMIGVGYLDPGNWSVDLSAGSQFGYSLLSIIFLANLMATLLQYLCIKLGVITGHDLAMACRRILPPSLNLLFYLLCETAIIATDLAEVIGTAIALKLLFSIPLPVGVAVTALDVLVILAVWSAKSLRAFEGAVMVLVGGVAGCFGFLHKLWR
ncbi:hypothetical protein HDU67_004182 [Dinochytrium kinnereticum]|nr:hypothetical protein HDU67_004182 [Dinochytrium kinnereticum]